MRYIVETTPDSDQILNNFLSECDNLEIITKYEPLEKLSGTVEKIGRLLKEYKQSGMNWKVLNYYLRGRGISQREIDYVLAGVEEFFDQFNLKDEYT